MEVLGQIGRDWQLAKGALGQLRRRQLAGNLGGGGGVNTGSGWLPRAGLSLRWVTPWGASLRLEGGATRSYSGTYQVNFLAGRAVHALDRTPATGFNGQGDEGMGTVREQQLGLSTWSCRACGLDGRRETVGELAVTCAASSRTGPWRCLCRQRRQGQRWCLLVRGSLARACKAGLEPRAAKLRVGAEALVGAAGGGGGRWAAAP